MSIVDCNLHYLLVLDTSRRQSKVKFNLKMHGGEITRLGDDFDSILVASLLVASLPGGEMTRWLIIFDLLPLHTCFPLDVGGSGRLHRGLTQ